MSGAADQKDAPPAADIRTFVSNEAGDLKDGWHKALGLDDSFSKFKSMKGLGESYQNLSKLLASDKVPIPKEDAKDEEWSAFWNKVGRPEKSDGYGVKKPDELDAGLWDDERAKGWAEAAHKLGLTKKQVDGLLAHEVEGMKKMQKLMSDRPEETKALLRKEWGAGADAKMDAAARVVLHLGGDELLKDPVVANHPAFIRAMAKVGELLSEKGALPGARDVSMANVNSVRQQLDSIMNNKDDAYWKPGPNQQTRVALVTELRRQLRELEGGK
jgi:hypothetical protein